MQIAVGCNCANRTCLGFEAEGRTWDIASKEPLGILRGHRHSIATSKLMCDRAESEKDFRAVTVDEYGEFRLWDIYIKEKTSEAAIYPTLQVFQMQNPEVPLNNIRFIALPNNPVHSTSYYSDLIAVGTKMLHFLPEKNAKDFIAPTCCVFNEPSAALMTAVGRNLVKYDITNGHYICTLQEVHYSDITCICLDGDRGRRLFAGCLNGDILLVNFLTGIIIDTFSTHAKEIVCITSHLDTTPAANAAAEPGPSAGNGGGNRIYAGTSCGRIKEFEESVGNLRLHNQIEFPFGEGVGIASIKIIPSLKIIVASAVGKSWGIWMESTLKKVFVHDEMGLINAVEILGASGDKEDIEFWDKTLNSPSKDGHAGGGGSLTVDTTAHAKRSTKRADAPADHLLTIAVALAQGVKIYTIDVRTVKGCHSFELINSTNVYFTQLVLLRAPEGCVNYAMNRPTPLVIGVQLIAVTDDGQIIIWDANRMRRKSEFMFRLRRHGYIKHGQVVQAMFGGGHVHQHHHKNDKEGSKLFDGIVLEGFNVDGIFVGFPAESPENLAIKAGSPIHKKGTPAHDKEHDHTSAPADGQLHSQEHGQLISDVPSTVTSSVTFLTETSSKAAQHNQQEAQQQSHLARQRAQTHIQRHNKRRGSQERTPICALHMRQLPRTRGWTGHLDSIPILLPLHEHGCVVTVSLDGYHKIWNIEKECLGELALPNLTEKMKNPSSSNSTAMSPARVVTGCLTWKFVLERIQVSQHHREVAATLLANLRTTSALAAANGGVLKAHRNAIAGKIDLSGLDLSHLSLHSADEDATNNNPRGAKNLLASSSSCSSLAGTGRDAAQEAMEEEASRSRDRHVRSLLEPPSYLDDAPPAKVFSKEERKEQRRQEQLLELSSSISLPELHSTHSFQTPTQAQSKARAHRQSIGLPSDVSVMTDSLSTARGSLFTSNTRTAPGSVLEDDFSIFNKSSNASVVSTSVKSLDSVTSQSLRAPPSLWTTADDYCDFAVGKVSFTSMPAFSEGSLNEGWNQGQIGAEEYNILRKVSSQNDKVLVYDRAVPLVLMRNVQLTASVTLPTEKSVKRSEISFGVQKVGTII
jgi:hypothetical protein